MRLPYRALWSPTQKSLRRPIHLINNTNKNNNKSTIKSWWSWWRSFVSLHFFNYYYPLTISWTRTTIIFSAAWFTAVMLTSSVVFCRPLDTPDYLIPYYLRDVATRFKHYATHHKGNGEEKYMTVEDFVRAVLASKSNEPLEPSVVEGMKQLFTELDADGNAYLSLNEFSFLMVLLTSKREDIRMLFSILDKDRVGALNIEEFAGVLRGLGCHHEEAESLTHGQKNGIVRRLFGEDGQRRCTFNEISETIDFINEEIWKSEFRQFDIDHDGYITAEQFGKLIANQMIGSHVPFYIVENIRKMRGSGNTITIELWISFHRIMQNAAVITEAVELFCSSGIPLRKKDFNRAVKAAGVPPFTDIELDLVMALFDRNSDGVLQFDEFVSVMQQKLTYHCNSISNNSREKKNFTTRLMECIGETLQN